jgi:hypothetical protein
MSEIKYYQVSDHAFNIIVNSKYATYNFLINTEDVPIIQDCTVFDKGNDKPMNYEFKSQAHAWLLFNDKMKVFSN